MRRASSMVAHLHQSSPAASEPPAVCSITSPLSTSLPRNPNATTVPSLVNLHLNYNGPTSNRTGKKMRERSIKLVSH
ncbi:hypothetical protein SLA2020_299550 [Shorea laevis]